MALEAGGLGPGWERRVRGARWEQWHGNTGVPVSLEYWCTRVTVEIPLGKIGMCIRELLISRLKGKDVSKIYFKFHKDNPLCGNDQKKSERCIGR